MKSVTKLKDEARKHEQREDWDRAIQIYLQVLAASEDDAVGESELPLYNRVGDLHVRMGRPAEAVRYYEQAADRYAEAGLFNNAIALCNKALRYQPARLSLFRKLGQYCAQQGFLTDARRWYLEFAERTFKHGDLDEAFSALEDFASISDDPEVRVHLARKLHAHDRPEEALTEFRRAYAGLVRAGDADAAAAVRTEVLELYPDGPDLADEEEAAEEVPFARGRHETAASELPTFGDTVEVPAPEPADETGVEEIAEPADDEPEAGLAEVESEPESERLDGFEGTAVEGAEDAIAEPAGGTLAGLDTGRDDTLDRLRREEEEAGDLPLLGDTPPAPPEEPAPGPALPLLGDEPAEAPPELEPPAVRADDVRSDHGPGDGAVPGAAAGEEYVDLYALLAPEEDRVETTRFFIQENEPTGDEDHDFAELLNQFRKKLAEHVPEDDAGSHYDLGLAFKEMGLIDDAISEFQIALRAGQDRLKVFEELGQCFILKDQPNIAVKVLSRALQFEHREEIELIGVYYFLGRAHEELGQIPAARDAYERVMGLDIRFEDVQERVGRL